MTWAARPRAMQRVFGAADDSKSPGVCVIEPQLSSGTLPGTLFPSNWLRPRFRWTPLPGENMWEIRLRAMNQDRPAVVRDNTNSALTTYPALYIWNQDPTTSNLTPAWDDFRIPPVPGPRLIRLRRERCPTYLTESS